MPSMRYINQSAPFWDFVASLEEQGSSHPFFADRRDRGESDGEETWGPWRFGRPPFHGPRGRGPPPFDDTGDRRKATPPEGRDPPPFAEEPHHDGPPSAPGADSPSAPPPPHHHEGPPPHHHEGPPGRRGFFSERRGRGGCRGGRHGFGRGGWGGWAGPDSFPPRGPFNFASFAEFVPQFFGQTRENEGEAPAQEDFKPEADIFDTETAFVVHVSLPGAKKEDVGVNWDSEKSELSIAGVIYRPGDEDFLKTLALDERKVGAFERKVRLGSRANPAQVNAEAISAKLEDGILRVEVPKLDKDYVEIKKVDIE